MALGILGPLDVVVDGRVVPVRARQQRVLLAALLLRANRVVSVSELVDRLWDESPPADPRGTVQKYVMRLRQLLADADGVEIRTEPEGYRIEVAPGLLDSERFQGLIAQAGRQGEAGNGVGESAALGAALELWRGVPPLSNVMSESVQLHEVPRLVEQYLQVLERRVEVDLGLGRGAALVGELTGLVREHPLRERFWAQRMRALAAAGRQGEALEAYREVTRLLAEELGVDPGPDLRAAHQDILEGKEGSPQPPGPGGGAGGQHPPRQLPVASGGFVGRQVEIDSIVHGLDAAASASGAAPMVVVSGPAGVGKTTLAVHAAHRVAPRFADGQLFADLRGYAPSAPVSVEEVLGQFLRGLGMAAEAVPLRREDQELAYRSLLADKRVLVVLDNVGTVADVRALLPGAPGCAVLVTSRDELAGLAVSPGAARVGLGVLSPTEARELVGEALGPARVTAEEPAAAQLITLCGALPLALRLAVAHLALRPQLGLAEYTSQLAEQEPVTMLQVAGDEHANLAAAFDWSYRLLPAGQRRLLRLLSLVPGPDLTAAAAAALTDVDRADAAAGLDALAAASLLDRAPRSRYRLHDLIRGYAGHRCRTDEPGAAQDDARRRLLAHYITTADTVLHPLIVITRLPRAAPPHRTVDPEVALAELDDDRAAMVAAVRDAADHGLFESAYHLADALRGYFMLRGHPVDWLTTAEAGLRAAQQAGHDEAIAAMFNGRGTLHSYTGDPEQASTDFQAALEIYERTGSPSASSARMNLGTIAERNAQLATAIKHYEAAIVGHQTHGNKILEQITRVNLIEALGDYGDLAGAQREGDLLSTATTSPDWPKVLGVFGRLNHLTGNLTEAADQFRRAIEEALARGDRRTEQGSRLHLAACYLEMGDYAAAHQLAEQVLAWCQQHDPRFGSDAELVLAEASRRMGRTNLARTWHERALHSARTVRDRRQECDALTGFAEFELAVGAPRAAAVHAAGAIELASSGSLRTRLTRALVVQACCHRLGEQLDQAGEAATEALAIARACQYPRGEALALAELGEIQLAIGHSEDASRRWQQVDTPTSPTTSPRRPDDQPLPASEPPVISKLEQP